MEPIVGEENQNNEEQPKVIPLVKRGRPKKVKTEEEEKPKVKKESLFRDNPRLYFRLYYQNRPREECSCPHCGNKFDSKRALNSHLRKSVICKKLRETKQNNEPQELSNLD